MAEKARIKEQQRKQKEKNLELQRVQKVITAKSRKTQHEVKQEDAIKKRADKLTQSLIHKNMNPHEKMKSISSVKEQVEDIIMEM